MASRRVRAVFEIEILRGDASSSVVMAEDDRGELWRAARAGKGRVWLRSSADPSRRWGVSARELERAPRVRCRLEDLCRILDASEAARLLGVSESFVRSAARRGRVPGAFRRGGKWLFRQAGVLWYAGARRRGRPVKKGG